MAFDIQSYAKQYGITVNLYELADELAASYRRSNHGFSRSEEPALNRQNTVVETIRNIAGLTRDGSFGAFALSQESIRTLVEGDDGVPAEEKDATVQAIVRELAGKIVDNVQLDLGAPPEAEIPLALERTVLNILRGRNGEAK